MRILSLALFAFTLPAQVSTPPSQPQWMAGLQKLLQDSHQAEIGSLDGQVEQNWQAALRDPRHPQFQTAAQMVSSFYLGQGYELKAEQVLRQATAAIPGADVQARWTLTNQLAAHFEGAGQLLKAVAIREQMAKQPRLNAAGGWSSPVHDAMALANLHERMGEFEKAEATWREVEALRLAAASQQESLAGQRIGVVSIPPGTAGGIPHDLADFYARRGRSAEAEAIYKAALAVAVRDDSPGDWNVAAEGYIGFLTRQRRYHEAIGLTRQFIERLEASGDPQITYVLLYKRQRLTQLLAQAGRPEEALATQRQAVEAAEARGPSSPEHVQALASLADTLIQQNRLEEAEKVAGRMREAGAADAQNARFHESMALQTLARIRDMQQRHAEALRLRESVGVPGITELNRVTSVYEVVNPAQQAAHRGDVASAVAVVDRAMAVAAERVRTNPQEVPVLMSLAQTLMSKQKEAEARRIAVETLQLLEQAPDHPRVADALGSMVSLLAGIGMTAEAELALERQKKILLAAKGEGSPALNSVGHARVAMLQRDSDWAGILDERKRMLARTEDATGPKSTESVYALREVAWAYPPLNNWPEEERVLEMLLGRTVRVLGESSVDHAHLLVHMANRANQNREFDRAVAWIGRAIEVARTLPDADMQLPSMIENRDQILTAKNAPPAGARCTPPSVPANGDGRWFDTNSFQRTDGATLGVGQTGAILTGKPAYRRNGTPNRLESEPVRIQPN